MCSRPQIMLFTWMVVALVYSHNAHAQPYPWPAAAPSNLNESNGYQKSRFRDASSKSSSSRPRKKETGSRSSKANVAEKANAPIRNSTEAKFTGPVMTIIWGEGDSLQQVSKVTGTTPAQILAVNHLQMSELREGQALIVPQPEGEAQELPRVLRPNTTSGRELWRGVRGKKRIALTFDAGSSKDGFDILVSHLKSMEVPATFFMTGEFQKRYPKVITQINDAGYGIHNHSWSHPDFTKLSDEQIEHELEQTDRAISAVTGRSTKPFWRPPFGERNNRVLKVAGKAGYQSIYWTIDSLDSFGEPKSSSFIANRVLNPPGGSSNSENFLDGAIILMHIGTPGTPQSIPQIVKSLRQKGYTFVTVDEILKP